MASSEPPAAMAHMRMIPAEVILGGQVDLRGYPYRHLVIVSQRGVGPERIMYAVAAAETLDRLGWDLVNVAEFTSSHFVYAFMRRR
jgi:hypothetical protein